MCERLKQLTRKVRGPVKTRTQRFESSHHRQFVWKRWAFGEPTPFEAGRPSGCERSIRSASASYVHVRQIRLAAAVRKTVALSGPGGSNPLTCTKLIVYLLHSGWNCGRSRSLRKAKDRAYELFPKRLRRLRIGRLPVEEYGASLNLVVAANFRRCTPGWFGGCSFKALIRGFDSRHWRHFCGPLFSF